MRRRPSVGPAALSRAAVLHSPDWPTIVRELKRNFTRKVVEGIPLLKGLLPSERGMLIHEVREESRPSGCEIIADRAEFY